jgi:hypothetical protein
MDAINDMINRMVVTDMLQGQNSDNHDSCITTNTSNSDDPSLYKSRKHAEICFCC